jgi:toxin ParE1/3/4
MAKFSFTNRALDDLIEIWDYTVEQWSENQAEKYYNLIMASCMDLANNPKLGRSYNIISQNLLGYKCGEHIIFYQEIVKNEIEIARVLHGMMDLKNKI